MAVAPTPLDPERKVAAVVVTYFPDRELAQRLDALLAQVSRVAIVDNGSDEASLRPLERHLATQGVTLRRNERNLGIGTALNQGIGMLAEEGFEWVLTLDQDSKVASGFVAAQLETLAGDPSPKDVAVIGANRQDVRIATPHKWLRPRRGFPGFERVPCEALGADGTTFVITSGTLTNIRAVTEVGCFREDLFIDMVDIELCLRLRSAGYRVLVSCGAELIHQVGKKRQHRILGVALAPTHHSPLRRYYLFRNSVVALGEHGRRHPHWRGYHLLAMIEVIAGVILLEGDKLGKLRACLAGLRDGMRGRLGPSPLSPR